jgi:hypothetical protein
MFSQIEAHNPALNNQVGLALRREPHSETP